MSEFKFACPVCRQHIRSDSSASGTQIECPTCFKKIVVPQAPADTSTKFILSAAQAPGKRPISETVSTVVSAPPQPGWVPWTLAGAAVVVLAGTVLAFVLLGGFRRPGWVSHDHRHSETAEKSKAPLPPPGSPVADARWRLDVTDAAIPETAASGRIRGQAFQLQRATIQNGTLALRQGDKWPPDVGVTILLPKRPAEDYAGKQFLIGTNFAGRAPRVVLRIKDTAQKEVTESVTSGYAMRLEFDKVVEGTLPGRIYLSTADAAQSVVVGSFRAEIRKPAPPKPPKPQPPPRTNALPHKN